MGVPTLSFRKPRTIFVKCSLKTMSQEMRSSFSDEQHRLSWNILCCVYQQFCDCTLVYCQTVYIRMLTDRLCTTGCVWEYSDYTLVYWQTGYMSIRRLYISVLTGCVHKCTKTIHQCIDKAGKATQWDTSEREIFIWNIYIVSSANYFGSFCYDKQSSQLAYKSVQYTKLLWLNTVDYDTA